MFASETGSGFQSKYLYPASVKVRWNLRMVAGVPSRPNWRPNLKALTLRRCTGRSWKTSDGFNGGGEIVGAITKQFHACVIFSSRTAAHRWCWWQLSKAPLDTRNFTRSFQPAVLRRADTTAATVTKSFVHYNEEHWFFCQQGSARLLLQICHRHLCWCITVSAVFHT